MRMAFGLVSLLVTIAIMLWLMVGGVGGDGYLQNVAKTNKQLKSQVNVMGGYDPQRQMLATDSIHCRVDRSSGKPKFVVTEVMAGGPMSERYDIRAGDRIIEIGGLDFDLNLGSHEAGMDQMHTAYSRSQPIVVMRAGQKLTLPTPEHVAKLAERDRQAALAASAAAGQSAMPSNPSTAPPPEPTALQRMLDHVRSEPAK